MAYKYELKNFIDSPDIAEYVTADMFSIGEQAVLISQSKKRIKDRETKLAYTFFAIDFWDKIRYHILVWQNI